MYALRYVVCTCHVLSNSETNVTLRTHTHTQVFIFTTITNFGPLTCSIFTTTRKFFTILGSVIFFGNSLLTRQWIGVVLVFMGLGLDIYFGKAMSATKAKSDSLKDTASGTNASSQAPKNKTVHAYN